MTLPLHQEPYRWPDRLKVSEWAERFRVLPRQQTANPGPWRNSLSPHLVGIIDAWNHPDVREITVRKAAQVGVSEGIRNAIGWVADQCPDPLLLVLPTEQDAERAMSKRILPLFRQTPQLRRLLTTKPRDVKVKSLILRNGFDLRVAWSHSASSLASDPIRFVVNDEVDKFAPFSGREASPLDLARVRTRTYGPRARIANISTPTTQDGFISQLFDEAELQLYYFVPCPACGHRQPMTLDRFKWPTREKGENTKRWAARIEREAATVYLCRSCQAEWREADKARIMQAGAWLPEDGRGTFDMPARVAFQLPVFVALWESWSGVAAEFLKSKSDPLKLMHFRNSFLGEPFSEQVTAPEVEALKDSQRRVFVMPGVDAAPVRVNELPPWTLRLYCTADVQVDHLYYVVRAWGHGLRSARVAHGACKDFEELRSIALKERYRWGERSVACHAVAVDSGYRAEDVYAFADSDPRVRPTKGYESLPGSPFVRRGAYRDRKQGNRRKSVLYRLDTNSLKDWLARLISDRIPADEPDAGHWRWLLDDDAADDEYQRHMRSEHKIVRRSRSAGVREVWVTRSKGLANHYWDCEVMQLALAWVDNLQAAKAVAPVMRRPDAPGAESPPAARPHPLPARQSSQERSARGFRRSYG